MESKVCIVIYIKMSNIFILIKKSGCSEEEIIMLIVSDSTLKSKIQAQDFMTISRD